MPLAAQELWAIWEALSFRFKGSRRGVWAAGPSSRLSSSVTRRQAARGKKQEVHKPDKPAQTASDTSWADQRGRCRAKGTRGQVQRQTHLLPRRLHQEPLYLASNLIHPAGERKGASARTSCRRRHLVRTAAADGLVIRGRAESRRRLQTAMKQRLLKEKIKMHKLRASITLRKQRFRVQSISTGTAAPLQKAQDAPASNGVL